MAAWPSSSRVGGTGCFCVVAAGRLAEHANLQILDWGSGGTGIHGHSWSELGSVESWRRGRFAGTIFVLPTPFLGCEELHWFSQRAVVELAGHQAR